MLFSDFYGASNSNLLYSKYSLREYEDIVDIHVVVETSLITEITLSDLTEETLQSYSSYQINISWFC